MSLPPAGFPQPLVMKIYVAYLNARLAAMNVEGRYYKSLIDAGYNLDSDLLATAWNTFKQEWREALGLLQHQQGGLFWENNFTDTIEEARRISSDLQWAMF
ncbi:hypothetical protein [Streptomyces sp. 900105245]